MPRLSVNINDETSVAIKTRMADDGRNATEVIRRAVSTYHYLMRQQEAGNEVLIRTPLKRNRSDVTLLEIR